MNDDHRVTIVTGGTRGFGRALTLAFARAGHEVCAVFKADQRGADEVARVLKAEGLHGRCVRHDVRAVGRSAGERAVDTGEQRDGAFRA